MNCINSEKGKQPRFYDETVRPPTLITLFVRTHTISGRHCACNFLPSDLIIEYLLDEAREVK